MCVCVRARVGMCGCVCVCACVWLCVHACTCVYVCVCPRMRVYVLLCVCVHVRMCVCVSVHAWCVCVCEYRLQFYRAATWPWCTILPTPPATRSLSPCRRMEVARGHTHAPCKSPATRRTSSGDYTSPQYQETIFSSHKALFLKQSSTYCAAQFSLIKHYSLSRVQLTVQHNQFSLINHYSISRVQLMVQHNQFPLLKHYSLSRVQHFVQQTRTIGGRNISQWCAWLPV